MKFIMICQYCGEKAFKIGVATIPETNYYQCENIACEKFCKKIVPVIDEKNFSSTGIIKINPSKKNSCYEKNFENQVLIEFFFILLSFLIGKDKKQGQTLERLERVNTDSV